MLGLKATSGTVLVLGFGLVIAGATLWFTRKGATPPAVSAGRIYAERGLIMAAAAVTAIGLLLLAEVLRDGDGFVFAWIGAASYLLAAAVILVAEGMTLRSGQGVYPLIVIYVIIAFLGQAAVGVALIQSGVVPMAIGWITIAWNLGFLIALPLVTPGDVYYPILHHMMPLMIGAALLLGR